MDSIVNQTLKDIEIICVNDCSTDKSLDIIKEYASRDKRISIINKPKNESLGCARNSGLANARGEYVGFVDSDDMISLDFCELLYNLAKKSDACIAVGDTICRYNEKTQFKGYVSYWTFKSGMETIQNISDKKNLIYACACWNKIYKLDFIKKYNIEFPHKLRFEDTFFTFASTVCANT